jgi:hypothetical protein
MPVMGPSDRQDDADQAFKEIAELLKTKYGVADITKDETFGMFSDEFNEHRQKFLKELREVFKLDSYNGF